MKEIIAIVRLMTMILSIIIGFIPLLLYCGICIFERVFKSKYGIATCPYCGIKIKYQKVGIC